MKGLECGVDNFDWPYSEVSVRQETWVERCVPKYLEVEVQSAIDKILEEHNELD